MIRCNADRVEISGPMTMPVALALLEEGSAALTKTTTAFDLSGVTDADSSGLALLFAWMRAAKEQGVDLRFENAPAKLMNLAVVYVVAEFLP